MQFRIPPAVQECIKSWAKQLPKQYAGVSGGSVSYTFKHVVKSIRESCHSTPVSTDFIHLSVYDSLSDVGVSFIFVESTEGSLFKITDSIEKKQFAGLVGSRTDYELKFTPTTIGCCISVIIDGVETDITNVTDW